METVETVIPSNAPASEAQLAAHEAVDEVAHEAIAETEDEDVSWLTSELQKTSAALSTLQGAVAAMAESQSSKFQALTEAMQDSREQSRTLIEAQTRMIETLTTNLSNLSQTALVAASPLSNATPPNLETESPQVETPIAVAEVVPAGVQEGSPADQIRGGKKRRRI